MDNLISRESTNGQGLVRTVAFLLMALAGLIIGYEADRSSVEKAKIEAEHYQEEKAQLTLSKIRAFLLNATQLSETLRVLVEQYPGKDEKQINEYLDRIVESAPDDLIYGAGVWYEPFEFRKTDRYFGPYVHRGSRPGTRILTKEWQDPNYNFHEQSWYRQAMEANGKPAFTEPYFDNGTVYMTLAVAFSDRQTGTVKGVVTVDMILPQLQRLIDSVNESSSDVITVIGKSGRLLAHPQSQDLIQKTQSKEKAGTVHSILDIPPKYFYDAVWTPIVFETLMPENGWKVTVASPRTSLMAGYINQRTLTVVLLMSYEFVLLIVFIFINLFTESLNRVKERSFQAITSERNQIKAIVDNVQFGLFRADSLGRIQAGYSQSCRTLLSLEPSLDMNRRTFWKYFSLSYREEANYETFFSQVFEVPFLAEEMADQIPAQLSIKGKTLAFRYYPIMKDDEVESILVAFMDVSRTHLMEIENNNNKALVRILRNKDRFADLINEILHIENTVLSPMAWPDLDTAQAMRNIRRIIHTWKGDLATFGVQEAVTYIHNLEDLANENMSVSHSIDYIKTLKALLTSYLNRYNSVLRIPLVRMDERHVSVSEKALNDLRKAVHSAGNIPDADRMIQTFIDQSMMENGEDILAYLSISAIEMGRRQEKNILVETKGGEIFLPRHYAAVLTSLNHVVRNAVDHGIEKSRDRIGKSVESHIEIEIAEDDHSYRITISDDGRGINHDKLREAVIAKGLSTAAQWELMDEDSQLHFIFIDSISTKSQVSVTSGRGVGLDHVMATVQAHGGQIWVATRLGHGTTFVITLPKAKAPSQSIMGMPGSFGSLVS